MANDVDLETTTTTTTIKVSRRRFRLVRWNDFESFLQQLLAALIVSASLKHASSFIIDASMFVHGCFFARMGGACFFRPLKRQPRKAKHLFLVVAVILAAIFDSRARPNGSACFDLGASTDLGHSGNNDSANLIARQKRVRPESRFAHF